MQLSIPNPQHAETPDLSPRVIYEYDKHRNIPWNETEYQPVRQYLDPVAQIKARKYLEQKKGEKDTNYLTRKGFYMDYHVKVVKQLPAPSCYKLTDEWLPSKETKKLDGQRKIDSSLGKYTYIDKIVTEQKNRHAPPVGKYNLNKTQSQIKEEKEKWKSQKRSVGDKRFYFQDTEYLSNVLPGMGSHNPHNKDIPHLKLNQTDHHFWTKKHDKQAKSQRKKRLAQASPGHYTPIPLEYGTFDRTRTAQEARKKKKDQKKNGFGTDSKFAYDRPNKKKIVEKRPDPGNHNVFIPWKGKSDQSKTKGWLRSRSTGFSQSVYN